MTPEQEREREQIQTAVRYFHEQLWDAAVGVADAFQVVTGVTLMLPRWSDLDDTRRDAFIVAASRETDRIVRLVGHIGITPPEEETPFGRIVLPDD